MKEQFAPWICYFLFFSLARIVSCLSSFPSQKTQTASAVPCMMITPIRVYLEMGDRFSKKSKDAIWGGGGGEWSIEMSNHIIYILSRI